MELKKNPNLESTKYTALFFNIGLVVAIGLVLIVFEWETVESTSEVRLESGVGSFEEVLDVTLTYQEPPPPPKLQAIKIIEVPDDEDIEESIVIDLDIDLDEEAVIQELVVEDAPDEEVADEVFSIVEVMPSFPGGNAEFYEYISKNLKYPKKAIKANVEGKVIVRFVVDENGDISDIEILKGIGFDCDEEAVRVLQSSPDWNPGKQRGRNVKVRVMVPLTFDI
jgi:protein TonB